jgi:hypothetical protein
MCCLVTGGNGRALGGSMSSKQVSPPFVAVMVGVYGVTPSFVASVSQEMLPGGGVTNCMRKGRTLGPPPPLRVAADHMTCVM